MNRLHSTYVSWREYLTPPTHTSTFLQTGKLTPAEFVLAGDYLVYKFPTWSWSSGSPSKRVDYLPADKQFLFTKNVPCHRRLDDNFAGAGVDAMVEEDDGDAEGGWLSTGGERKTKVSEKDVKTVDEEGVEEEDQDDIDSIPDMEDEEDDEAAIIRDVGADTKTPLRTYTLYITYTTYFSTPRLYLSGASSSPPRPLTSQEMMQDIIGDYADKTVTIEEFPHLDGSVKMPSVHPCKHASVMHLLLERANAAAKRKAAAERGEGSVGDGEKEWEEVDYVKTLAEAKEAEPAKDGVEGVTLGVDGLEVKDEEGEKGEEEAIRVDQYLIVFLKFMASVTPGIEHDYTMGL